MLSQNGIKDIRYLLYKNSNNVKYIRNLLFYRDPLIDIIDISRETKPLVKKVLKLALNLKRILYSLYNPIPTSLNLNIIISLTQFIKIYKILEVKYIQFHLYNIQPLYLKFFSKIYSSTLYQDFYKKIEVINIKLNFNTNNLSNTQKFFFNTTSLITLSITTKHNEIQNIKLILSAIKLAKFKFFTINVKPKFSKEKKIRNLCKNKYPNLKLSFETIKN